MKIIRYVLLGSLLPFWGIAQPATLIYDCLADSNDYLTNLQVIGGELYFQSGKWQKITGGEYCGRPPVPAVRARHVYRWHALDATVNKRFHHSVDSIIRYPRPEERADSSRIFRGSTYFPLSAGRGVVLFESATNYYWTWQAGQWQRIDLAAGQKVSSYHPQRFLGELLVRGQDSLGGGRIWYLDSLDLQLRPFLPDTFPYETHNWTTHDQQLIFHGYCHARGQDHSLFVANKNGQIRRIAPFPLGMVGLRFQAVFAGKIIYSVTHRGFQGNYDHRQFKHSELWAYDLETQRAHRLYDFGRYGVVNSPLEYQGKLYFTFGHLDHQLYSLATGGTVNPVPFPVGILHCQTQLKRYQGALWGVGKRETGHWQVFRMDETGHSRTVGPTWQRVRWLRLEGPALFLYASTEIGQVQLYHWQQRQQQWQTIGEPYTGSARFGPQLYPAPGFIGLNVPQDKGYQLFLLSSDRLEAMQAPVPLTLAHHHFDQALMEDYWYFLGKEADQKEFHQLWRIRLEE